MFRLSAPKDLAVSAADGGVVHAAEANGGVNSDEFRQAQNSFAWRLSDLLARLCHAHSRPVIRLVFKLWGVTVHCSSVLFNFLFQFSLHVWNRVVHGDWILVLSHWSLHTSYPSPLVPSLNLVISAHRCEKFDPSPPSKFVPNLTFRFMLWSLSL